MSLYEPPEPGDFSLITNDESLQASTVAAYDAIQIVRPDVPGDGSPGALGLVYIDSVSEVHGVSMNLTTVADPYNYPQMLAEANRLAPALAAALPDLYGVQGMRIWDAEGVLIFSGLLSASSVGTWPNGNLNSYSYSVSITGRGLASGPGLKPGNTLLRIFPRKGYPFELGRKQVAGSGQAGLLLFMGALGTSTVCWADAHGWKAGIRPNCPIQFNAGVQNKKGV